MAQYSYDESGNMAAYFIITFLVLVLVPLTLSISPSSRQKSSDEGCQCGPCIDQRKRVAKRENRSILNPKFTKKSIVLLLGWSLCGFLVYKVAGAKNDNKVYNPFEILNIATSATEKEIKSHYKKLSRMYHPDKVRATANETLEMIQDRFVDITKAYKSLTDVVIRENYIKYGHPDGRQELTMGIALPRWIIEGRNNIWVLGFYGIVFGAALPMMVGRWWFGSRQKTKDGVHVHTASAFFRGLKEESDMDEVVGTLGTAFRWEYQPKKTEIEELEKEVKEKAGRKWDAVVDVSGKDAVVKRALVLLYAYLLRLPIESAELKKEQNEVLLQTPVLLNALLNVTMVRGWLLPTISILRLHAYIAQALLPSSSAGSGRFAQLPGINPDEPLHAQDVNDVVKSLETKGDSRVEDAKKAMEKWGRIEIVDAAFKVVGERIITPSSFVNLVVKVRVSPPSKEGEEEEKSASDQLELDPKKLKEQEERDLKFLSAKGEAEDIPSSSSSLGWAHAPYWPANRKPGWFLFTVDEHKNRIIVPPLRITDVPVRKGYRSYKVQFQAPPNTGVVQWRLYLVSDTYVGEEVSRVVSFTIDDFSALNADEQNKEDEISDPEEDSIAGQMAAMRGGKVKRTARDEESDEESSTDDDQEEEESDSSDDD